MIGSVTGPAFDASASRRLASVVALLVVAGVLGWLLGVPLPTTASGWLPVLVGGVVAVVAWVWVLPKVLPSLAARLALLVVVALAAGWYLVSPLFIDREVVEAMPGAAPTQDADAGEAPQGDEQAERIAGGTFKGIGHQALGSVGLYRLADGSTVVRLEDVDIQNGPDLFVYLVPEPDQSDDAGGVNLGRLEGNRGSHNYPVPADVDAEDFSTVLVWCRAFSTPFGNATLSDA